MVLAKMSWNEVNALSRDVLVVIPTGSLEQHGTHLPLFTDSLIVTAVAEAVEARLSDKVLLTPTLWLGSSGHHLAFSGSLSADFQTHIGAIDSVVESLIPHGFTKFMVLNGHGGNTDPNGIATRTLKQRHPELTFGHIGYYDFLTPEHYAVLEGPQKTMRHADEAEASLMLHLHPDLVRVGRLRDDGLTADPPAPGVVHRFDEITEQGSLGYASFATAAKGKTLFEASVDGVAQAFATIADGYLLRGLPKK